MPSLLADPELDAGLTMDLQEDHTSSLIGGVRWLSPANRVCLTDRASVDVVDVEETSAGSLFKLVDKLAIFVDFDAHVLTPRALYAAFAPRRVLAYRHGISAEAEPVASSPTTIPLATIVDELRRRIDLPIHDIARMCGVQRRQFYNLLDGTTKNPQEESHIRLLHHVIGQLYQRVGADPASVRAAILTPLESLEYETLFATATNLDSKGLRRAFTALSEHLELGGKLTSRPAPSGGLGADADWNQARDHLRGYPPSPE